MNSLADMVSRPKGAVESEAFGATSAAPPQPTAASSSTADEIVKLATLRDSGAITSAKFDAAKAKALAV